MIDIKLPHGDGPEVYRKVCEVNPDARTVLIAGESAGLNDLVDQILVYSDSRTRCTVVRKLVGQASACRSSRKMLMCARRS